MLKVKVLGKTSKTEKFLKNVQYGNYEKILPRYGQLGVDILRSATPIDTGETADSWRYKISKTKTGLSLQWLNDSVTDSGIPVVVLLIHGHGTQNGSYVSGNDFVTPAMKPLFDNLATNIMKEVK